MTAALLVGPIAVLAMTAVPRAGQAAGHDDAWGPRLASASALATTGLDPAPRADTPATPVSGPLRADMTLYNVNTRETLALSLPFDGRLAPTEKDAVARFFRCKRSGRAHAMDPGVLAMLADLAHRYPDRVIEIVSGFRGRRWATQDSKHRFGHAIDLRVRGVEMSEVRDYLWRTHRGVGIGYYVHQNFVHMDTRPGEGDIAWTQRREGRPNRYHPEWAALARGEDAGAEADHGFAADDVVVQRSEVESALTQLGRQAATVAGTIARLAN
jgi:uncharacterized protein YcbK (DUF882 family)